MMFPTSPAFLAISALLTVTPTSSLPVVDDSGSDVDQKLDRRIVNGEQAMPNSFPFMASFRYNYGNQWKHLCGGSLIAPQWVLTAAHCFWDSDKNRPNTHKFISMVNVVLGEHDMERKSVVEQYEDIDHVVVHPRYNQTDATAPDDIALVKLKSPVTPNKYIAFARISRDLDDNLQKADCVIVGWGSQEVALGPTPRFLQQAPMELVPFKECWKKWVGAYEALITRTQVCVKHKTSSANQKPGSSCSGDSGGPLMCGGQHDVITGITSFGFEVNKRCGSERLANVYTRVAAYSGWIEGHTGDLSRYHP